MCIRDRNAVIYLRRQQSGAGGEEIAEVLRSAWRRLWRKQLLFLYPFVLAVLNSIAFLAIYTAMGGPVRWEAFAHANFSRWLYIHCLLYTSDAADDLTRVDLGGRRIIKKKKKKKKKK